MTEKLNIVSCSIKKLFTFIETWEDLCHTSVASNCLYISLAFLVFLSNHWTRIVCVTQEYQRFMPTAISVFAGRRCMSVMLFDRTTKKMCLCSSATRRYFAARTKRVFYTLYIQGEMQMETIFILQKDDKYPWFRYRNSIPMEC